MQRFLPLNRRAWKWFLLPGILLVVLLISAFGSANSGIQPSTHIQPSDAGWAEQGSMSSTTSPTDHFRSNGQDTWQTVGIWQSSPDSLNWITATMAPTHLASSIVIRNSNTVRINTGLSIDQLTILQGGVLRHEAGVLTILNGPGDDVEIREGGVLQFGGGSWPVFQNSQARIRVKNTGIVRVNTAVSNISQHLAGNSSSGKFIYETGAIFEWNNGGAFSTSGQTYFPDAGPNDRPIFRITWNNVTAGASSTTTFNGVLEVNAATAFNQSGNKVFRNGIIGSAALTQVPGSGKFIINGDSAILGGVGLISLQASAGSNVIETGENTYLSLTTSKVINAGGNGKLVIKGTSTLDTKTYSFSGTAGIILENDITYITAHPTGFNGALGSFSGGIVVIGPFRQTYVFNRNGLQDSGTTFPVTAGRFIITNGSKLNLSSGLFINNVADGFIKIEGSGSELRANATRAIEIVGSRSLILENGGTMHASCLDYINIATNFTDGVAFINGNGHPIRCNSLSTTKITGGGLTLAPETDLEIRTSLTVNYFYPAVFIDNGNTIEIGDDLQMTGSTGAAQYNLTGTIVMTGVGAGNSTSSIRSQANGAIHAELNNLVINSNSNTSYPQFEPSTGNANIKIKGDFIIQNAHPTRPMRLFGNTYHIGGNFSNMHQNRLLEGTSTLVFDGTENQTITCPGGEVFSNFEIDKVSGDLHLESNLTITGSGTFTSGLIHPAEHLLLFGPTGSAAGASQSSYVNGKVRKTGFTAEVPFVFPVGDFMEGIDGWNVFQPAELETESTSATAAFDVQYHHENFNVIFPQPFNPPTAGIGTVSTCNYWDIDRISGTLPAKVGLSWNEAHCFDVTEPAALLVARYSDESEDWSEANFPTGATHEFSAGPQYATGWVRTLHPVSAFSPFAIGNIGAGNNVLPIELLEFTARVERSRLVMTHWTTLSETNNDFFTVERSANAMDWEAVGQVSGAGTSQSLRSYALADDAPIPGRSYYRLKQTDFDGTFTYSEIETVLIDVPKELEIIHLYRNGAGLELGIHAKRDMVTIEIFELTGKRVLHEGAALTDSPLVLRPNLSQGVYILRVTDSENAVSKKFFY